MPVIHLPLRRTRELAPIHRSPARVGIFVAAPARPRVTGPQAHLHPYVGDEDRAAWRAVGLALRRGAIVAACVIAGVVIRRVMHGGAL